MIDISYVLIMTAFAAGIAYLDLWLMKEYIKNDNTIACMVLVAVTTLAVMLTPGVI